MEQARDYRFECATRLAGDAVKLDDIERLLIGLQRAGHLTRNFATVGYLRNFEKEKDLRIVERLEHSQPEEPAVKQQYEASSEEEAGAIRIGLPLAPPKIPYTGQPLRPVPIVIHPV